jgi:hypothetical protein
MTMEKSHLKPFKSCVIYCVIPNLCFLYIQKKQLKKGLIKYYKTRGITCLKKNVDVNHFVILKNIKEEVNSLMKGNLERQFAEKNTHVLVFPFLIFCIRGSFQMKNHLPL